MAPTRAFSWLKVPTLLVLSHDDAKIIRGRQFGKRRFEGTVSLLSVDSKVCCSFAALFLIPLMSSGAHLDVPGHVPDEADPLPWLQLPGQPVVLQVLDSRHAAAGAHPDQLRGV